MHFAPRRKQALMESSFADMFFVLLLIAVPTSILLGSRFFNRRWDKAASLSEAEDAFGAPSRQGG